MALDQNSDDLIVWGARDIGRVINRNERQTRHLIDKGVLPVRNHRGLLSARVGDLRQACRATLNQEQQVA
jgi:hypothetical protein